MAVKTWNIRQINAGGVNRLWYDEAAAVTAATSVTGWTVGTTVAARYSDLANGTERAATTFGTAVLPNNTAPAVDASFNNVAPFTPPDLLIDAGSISTLYEYNAYFAAGTWQFNFPVIAVSAGNNQDGRIRLRVFKGLRSGTAWASVTELTESGSAPLTGSTVTNLTTGAVQTSAVTWTAPAFFLNREFLIIKIAWQITGAGSNAARDVLLRFGAGADMTTPTFRKRSYNIT